MYHVLEMKKACKPANHCEMLEQLSRQSAAPIKIFQARTSMIPSSVFGSSYDLLLWFQVVPYLIEAGVTGAMFCICLFLVDVASPAPTAVLIWHKWRGHRRLVARTLELNCLENHLIASDKPF